MEWSELKSTATFDYSGYFRLWLTLLEPSDATEKILSKKAQENKA